MWDWYFSPVHLSSLRFVLSTHHTGFCDSDTSDARDTHLVGRAHTNDHDIWTGNKQGKKSAKDLGLDCVFAVGGFLPARAKAGSAV